MIVINESGLYSLILTSRTEGAKKFKKWITSSVLPTIRKTGGYGDGVRGVPQFTRRYHANSDRVAQGYFSVVSELFVRIWAKFERHGYIMKDNAPDGKEIRPDISIGRRFADWLDENHPEMSGKFKTYDHWTAAGTFPARQYENGVLPFYIEFVDTIWLPEHAAQYFGKRDPGALEHLPKLLPKTGGSLKIAK